MSQHPNASPSPLAGEIAAVIGEFVTAQANAMHAVARLAMLTRDLVEGTSLTSSAPEIRQEIADLAERLSPVVTAEPRTNRAERREMILDLYATTDLSGHAIARRAGVVLDTPRKIIRKAREAGDRRAAQGDLRRQPAADQAAPLRYSPSTPRDGLPENGGNASPERPVESGASGTSPAKGEEVVPTSRAGEELTTSDDPAPAPEPDDDRDWLYNSILHVEIDEERALKAKPIGVISDAKETPSGLVATAKPTEAGRSVIDALHSANERILRPAAEMELADELKEEAPPVSRTTVYEERLARAAALADARRREASEKYAAKTEPALKRGPAGLAQRAAARVEKRQEPAPAPVIKIEVPTEEQVGLPILHVDRKAKTVTGPIGVMRDCSSIVLDVCERLADGRLYSHEKIQQIAGVTKEQTFGVMLSRWKRELRDVGVEVYDQKGYGLRLHRREVA